MNRPATRENFKKQGLSLSGWARANNVNYALLFSMLNGGEKRLQFTLKQVAVVRKMKAAGLYVPSDNEPEIEGEL